MTRSEAIEYLDAHIGLGVQPGLERIAAFLATMGDPHLAVPVVHVTGTNGKTSTVRMVSALLSAHGLSVGTFTSPHLERVEERFALGGAPLHEAAFVQAVEDVKVFADVFSEQLTYFELTAAVAFAAFADAAVDVAVIEVGLGGRLDATNVVRSDVAVITTVGIEHTEYLGDTLHSIATEKAAILDQGARLVTGQIPAAAEGPMTARVDAMKAVWRRWGTDYRIESARPSSEGWLVDVAGIYETYPEVELRMRGRHQTVNFATAVAACEEFFGRALDLNSVKTAAGAANPGRMEIVAHAPLVMLDGAHNASGVEALASSLREEFAGRQWVMVLGVLGDKDLTPMFDALDGLVMAVVAVAPQSDRARPVAEIVDAAEAAGVSAAAADSVAAGVERARTLAGATGSVLVTGSLYTVGEARSALV